MTPLFEQEHRGHIWRLQATEWNGKPRLQVWPWYREAGSGELRPGSSKNGGGFAIPLDRVPELIEALQGALADDGECGPAV